MSGTDQQTLSTQTDASLKSDSAQFANDHGGSGLRGAADTTTAGDSQFKSKSTPGIETSPSGLDPGQPLKMKGAQNMKDSDDAGMESHAEGFSMLDQAKSHLGMKEKK